MGKERRITPGADLLPALVVGWEVDAARLDPDPEWPPWLLVVDPLYGGLASISVSLLGAVLRLEPNRGLGQKDLSGLIEALRAPLPPLDAFTGTEGQALAPGDLRALDDLLAGYLRLPPLRAGHEALARFPPCRASEVVGGWAMTACAPSREKPAGPAVGRTYLTVGLYDLLAECVYGGVFDADAEAKLMVAGAAAAALTAPPGLMLLWQNAD